MAETVNIARIAELCSDKIFCKFGWNTVGPKNINFSCLNKKSHKNHATHPCDVVFSYEHPYQNETILLLTDLKSYGSESIQKSSIQTAIENLAASVQCAAISQEWKDKYAPENFNHQIDGLLFVYNHDSKYRKNFSMLLNQIETEKLIIPKGRKIYILGPEEILYLSTIATDLKLLRADKIIPDNNGGFHCPNLVLNRTVHQTSNSAPIEHLLGPWIVYVYENHTRNGSEPYSGSIFYASSSGENVDEFKYMIDYLFRFQLCGKDQRIQFRLPNANDGSQAIFQKALDSYFQEAFPKAFQNNNAVLNQKVKIELKDIEKRTDVFHSENIGMRNE